jgi:hypothetical protein
VTSAEDSPDGGILRLLQREAIESESCALAKDRCGRCVACYMLTMWRRMQP